MKTTVKYLEDQTTVSDTDTRICDLKGLPPVSAIDVIYRAQNGATSNTLRGLDVDIPLIEVIDGGTVIQSLDGSQLLGVSFYQGKAMPEHDYNEGGNAVQRVQFRQLFGRYLGDPEYYLDPAQFRNPQLRCKNTLTISATAGYTSGTGTLTVIVHLLEEGYKARRGTIRVREFKEFTSAASGEERTEIPTDEVFRRLYVRAYESAVNFETDITHMRIEDAARTRITDNIRMTDLFSMLTKRYGLAQDEKRLLAANDDTRLCQIQTIREVAIQAFTSARNASIDAVSGERVTVDLYDLATPTADTTPRPLSLLAKGFAPWATVAWDFGVPEDPDSWWDATALEKIYLVLTQGGAGALTQVMAETIMR